MCDCILNFLFGKGYGYGSAPQFGGAQWGAAPVAPAQAPPPHQSSWNNAYAAPQQSGIQQSYGNYGKFRTQ